MKLGSKSLAIILLFLGLVLINYLATSLPLRFDATSDSIYTLSDGTKSLLSKLEEPVSLQFFFSKNAKGLPISYKNFAARVQEMLRQYVRASGGKVTLTVIEPRPDTPEEEKANTAGLQAQMLPTGEQIYFGLVATQADQQKNITAFNLQRESFLEYDLSQLIYSVQQVDKKKLGLLSSLPLRAPMDYMAIQRTGRMPQNQFVLGEWEKSFEIVSIEPSATELPSGIEVLAVIHPQNVSPKLQYAIDQFLLSGKPVFLAVDPSSQHFKRQGGQMGMMGGPQPNVSSDLPTLLGAYGVTYNPTAIVGDLLNATKVQTGVGTTANYPVWISLNKTSLSDKAMATAQLNSVMFVESGYLSAKPDSGLTFLPLAQTSEQAGDLQAMALQFAQPEDISRQITPSGKKTLAAMITGKFKTAFPEGAPKEAPAADEKKEGDAAKPAADKKAEKPQLKDGNSTLIVFADTDWLLDDFSVRRFNFLGVQAAEPFNDNLYLSSNSLEFLGGSKDLVSIRGKGNALRPFTVVKRMEAEAQKKYQDQLAGVESKLTEVQRQLTQLQGKKGEAKSLVSSPEVQKAIDAFQKQEIEARRERREIRRALREDIDSLENFLLITNLLATPLLVGAFGIWFYRRRRA